MDVVIYQSLIIYIIVLINGVYTIDVLIDGSKEGLIGENGTQIQCSYPLGNYNQFSVSFWAMEKNSKQYEQIATYIPGSDPLINTKGAYLKGRVTLTPITHISTQANMTFTKLMCIDDKFYRCQARYIDSNGYQNNISNNISITVQVPPSKPESVSLFNTPADSSVTTTEHMGYSTSLPSTAVTSNENNTVSASKMENQNTTAAFNHTTTQNSGHDITSPTPSLDEVSSNSRYRPTTYSLQQTTIAQDIAEGDNITIVCKGHVGNPPAEYFFQKYRIGHLLSMNYTATDSNLSEIAENCSYFRTSSFTFQVTAKDNNVSIRCVVNSSMPEFDKQLYEETAPIEVNYEVRMPNITKYPNKDYYVVGKDTSIHLTCKSEGNPQPVYFWYKNNSVILKTASANLTIMVMNKTDSGVYTCRVSNTFSGETYRRFAEVQVDVINEADTSTLPSSSTGTSSGTGEKHGNQKIDLKLVVICVAVSGVCLVLLGLLGYYLLKKKRKGKDESTENNGSTNNLMHYSSKHGGESRPGGYDSVILEGDALVISSGKKGQNVEDVRKHNEEYMKNQTNEEKNDSKSPKSDQPVIYAEVNKENKIKYRQETSNQQDDDTYAGTQEGIYDRSGNSRHKVNKNTEQFDNIGDIKKQNSTDDAESSLQSSQKGSYINHALNKGEKQVATVPPISRSSVGSQGDEQTTESIAKLSQKEYENVKGTDTTDGHTINQTSL